YLLPWDGDPKFLASTAYPVKRLYAKLNALAARRIVVALDSCFSGAGGRSVIPQGLRPLVTKIDVGGGRVGRLEVLAATGPDEVTGTADAEGHGLFTYYLLKGLNRSGGKGTVKTLYDYLRPKVADAAREDGRDQMPQLLGTDSAVALGK
ncbi:MAG: caspase family protein, partial [Elusimicrobia bacterium]|nr:caspase family protein [Elusimicrobiota bacterium]